MDTDLTELTPEIVREFVDRIIVHAPDKSSGRQLQEIEIIYNHIGVCLKEIPEWLGHNNISATANIYTHMDFNRKISSANAIIGILNKEKESTSATD